MKTVVCLLLVSVFGVVIASAEEPVAESSQEYVRPYPVIAIPAKSTAAHKATAKEIADAIGVRLVIESKTNPGCCVWVEITGWSPNPGETGYVIINQPGGSLIQAANQKQLTAAASRFVTSLRKTGGKIEAPVGLLTSYPIVVDSPSK